MKINEAGLQIIKESEGFRSEPYFCPAGVLTIGYGTTGSRVKSGMKIDEATAERWLQEDVEIFESAIASLVEVPLNENQFSALVSFVYNIGANAFGNSTLLTKINNKDYEGAAEEFGRWVKAGSKTLPGLVTRREKEKQLFETPVAAIAFATPEPQDKDRTFIINSYKYYEDLPHQQRAVEVLADSVDGNAIAKMKQIWRSNPIATYQPVILEPKPRGRLISILGLGEVGLEDSIIPDGNFKWGEATKEGTRISESQTVTRNILAIAEKLEEVRAFLGNQPIAITSWYRPPHVNRSVGGAKFSKHLKGHGVDIYPLQMNIFEAQQLLEPWWMKKRYGGFGRGAHRGKGFIHLDLRTLLENQPPVSWNY